MFCYPLPLGTVVVATRVPELKLLQIWFRANVPLFHLWKSGLQGLMAGYLRNLNSKVLSNSITVSKGEDVT